MENTTNLYLSRQFGPFYQNVVDYIEAVRHNVVTPYQFDKAAQDNIATIYSQSWSGYQLNNQVNGQVETIYNELAAAKHDAKLDDAKKERPTIIGSAEAAISDVKESVKTSMEQFSTGLAAVSEETPKTGEGDAIKSLGSMLSSMFEALGEDVEDAQPFGTPAGKDGSLYALARLFTILNVEAAAEYRTALVESMQK